MATANPMSLKFSTQLDNSRFIKGAGELQQAIGSLRGKLSELSANAGKMLGFTKASDALKDSSRDAQQFEDDVREMAKALEDFDKTTTFVQARSALAMMTKMVGEFASRTYTLEDGTKVIGEQTESYTKMQEALEELNKFIDENYDAQEEMNGSMEDAQFFMERFNKTVEEAGSLGSIEARKRAVSELKRQMEEFGSTNFSMNGMLVTGTSTDQYKQMGQAIKAVQEDIEEASHSPAWNSMAENWKSLPTVSVAAAKAVDNAAKGIRSAVTAVVGSTGQIRKSVRDAQDLERDVAAVGGAFSNFDAADNFLQAQSTLNALTRQVERFAETTYRMEDGTEVLGRYTEQYGHMADSLATLREALDSTDESQKNMVGDYNDMAFFTERFQETVNSLQGVGTLEGASDVIKELTAQMREFAETDFLDGDSLGFMKGSETSQYSDMQNAVDELNKRLEAMRGGVLARIPEAFKQAFSQAGEAIKGTAKGAADNVTKSATGAGFLLSQAFEHPVQTLDRLGGAAMGAAGKIAEMAKAGAAEAVKGVGTAAAEAGNGLTQLAQGALTGIPALLSNIGQNAGSAASRLAKMAGGGIVSGIKMLPKPLLEVMKNAGGAANNLGKMATSRITGGIKGLAGSILGAGRNAKQFGQHATLSFKRVLGYAIGISSLMQLFNKLKSAIKEGFKAIMDSDPEFAQTVNNLKKSVEDLKVSFAAAFMPLANMVIPVIQRIINALAQAISYIGQFIAALTGQNTYKIAIRNQDASADAANNAADAYGNAAKAAKEEKKTIASFDELHILDKNEDKEDKQPQYSFQDAPVEQGISDLADALKRMWDLADFTELGRKLGEGLKWLLDQIPWDYIKEIAAKLGKSLATLLNGFMEVPGLFYKLGDTLAQAINTIFELLNAFVTNLHWDSLGNAIKEFLLGLLDNIDWNLIHDTFAKLGAGIGTALESAFDNPEIWTAIFTTISNAVTALLLLLYNLFTTPNWASIAKNIGIGLNEGVKNFPWSLLSETIAAGLNMVFDFVYNFLTTFDFYSLGAHIGQAITDAVGNTNWAEGGAALSAAINALFDFLNGLLVDTDWKLIGQSIVEFISGFFNELDTSKWGEFIFNFWTSLFDFLSGIIETVDWKSLPDNICNKIGDFLSTFNWDEFAEKGMNLLGLALGAALTLVVEGLTKVGGAVRDAFTNLIDGGLEGIVDALKNISKWISDHIFTPFINAFNQVFDINSPSKKMKPFGSSIIEGVGAGIINWLKNIPAWLAEHVGNPIIKGVMKVFGIGSGEPALEDSGEGLIEGLKKGAGSVMSTISGWLKGDVTDPIKDGIETGLGTNSRPFTEESGHKVVEGLKDGMSDEASGLENMVSDEIADPIVDGIKDPFGISGSGEATEFKGIGQSAMSGLSMGMEYQREATMYTVRSFTQSMLEAFNSINWTQVGTMVINGAVAGLTGGWNYIYSTVSDFASSLIAIFDNIDWSRVGTYMLEGIRNGLYNGWDWIYNAVTDVANSLLNAAKYALGIASPSKEFAWVGQMITEGLAEGLDDSQKTAVDSAVDLAEAVIDGANGVKPLVNVQAATDGLDNVLTTFSDKVTGSFADMVARMEAIVEGSSFYVPATAAGAVLPFSARGGAGSGPDEALSQILEKLTLANYERLTRSDLLDILVRVFREYMNISFYLSDEQVSRHAIAGSEKIDRRYNPVSAN